MKLNIGIIKGDGIGPEIVTEAMKVLDKVGEIYGHTCDYTELLAGRRIHRCAWSAAYR